MPGRPRHGNNVVRDAISPFANESPFPTITAMTVLLRCSRELPPEASFDAWFAVTGTNPALDPGCRLADVGLRLENAFLAIRDDWWSVAKTFGRSRNGDLVHAFSCAPIGSDFGLALAWARLVADLAEDRRAILVVCDDPWLFRHLMRLGNVAAGKPPPLWPAILKGWVRGYLARGALALRLAWTAWRLGPTRRYRGTGETAILVYGHPQSRPDGTDAYFGSLMKDLPTVARLLHTDCPLEGTESFESDRRTASLHAWGSPWFALRLAFVRWRPGSDARHGPYGRLLSRVAALEGQGGSHAMNRWFDHCVGRWLADRRPGSLAWPWENLPWERLLVRRAHGLGIPTVGYQHADVGPQQYNMGPQSNWDGLASLPDRLLLNGPAYRAQLIRWGFPEERLAIGGAFRVPAVEGTSYDPTGPVFVALSGAQAIARQMIEAVEASRGDGRLFLIKNHPMYPIDFEETDDMRRWDRPLGETAGLSAVLFATGLSGLEGLLAGVPTFRLLLDDRVGIDTMPENCTAIPVTASTLRAALDQRPEPPQVQWSDLFSRVDLEVWRGHLSHTRATRPNALG